MLKILQADSEAKRERYFAIVDELREMEPSSGQGYEDKLEEMNRVLAAWTAAHRKLVSFLDHR